MFGLIYLVTQLKTDVQSILAKISKLQFQLDQLQEQVTTKGVRIMSSQLDPLSQAMATLTAQVAQNTSVEASAVSLIQGLASQIAASANDPAAITALSTQLENSASALAAAISANTPAAPAA